MKAHCLLDAGMDYADYSKQFRRACGFNSKEAAKDFLAAKDITAEIDYNYIDNLNNRIINIFQRLNTIAYSPMNLNDLEEFCAKSILLKYKRIRENGLLPILNNQGRRPEHVLFSWLRGSATADYFIPRINELFQEKSVVIQPIGEDDLSDPTTFKRGPRADYKIIANKKIARIEVQSGFQGINDIKQHKVLEARKVFDTTNERTICIHFDIFNGMAAVIDLSSISDDDIHWVTRQQMEGQTVFNIDQNCFKWQLRQAPPLIGNLECWAVA